MDPRNSTTPSDVDEATPARSSPSIDLYQSDLSESDDDDEEEDNGLGVTMETPKRPSASSSRFALSAAMPPVNIGTSTQGEGCIPESEEETDKPTSSSSPDGSRLRHSETPSPSRFASSVAGKRPSTVNVENLFEDDRSDEEFEERGGATNQPETPSPRVTRFASSLGATSRAKKARTPKRARLNADSEIGRIGDGGKWMCGPQFIADWNQKCVIYSFGIKGDFSFETEIHATTKGKCEIIAVDMIRFDGPDRKLKEIGAKYVLTKIDNVTSYDSTTVTDLMKRFEHSHIDVLKMDIEGYEYYITDELFKLGICQMMVELHTEDTKYENIIKWLKKASAAGYYLIHHEANIKHMSCVEVTLLHQKCFDRFGDVLPLTKFLSIE